MKIMFKRSLFSVSLLLYPLFSYSQDQTCSFDVSSQHKFDEMAGEPLSHIFAGVSAVKLVYHLEEKKLYFIQSKKYPLHYNFCRDKFEDVELPVFNELNYRDNSGRKYILATLNYFHDAGNFTLEFSPADNISQENVEMMYAEVKHHFFDTAHLYLQISTQTLMKYKDWEIPVITVNELFAGQKLQIIQTGKAAGRLMIVDADSLGSVGDVKNYILVIRGSSNEIPLCRGIITTDFQTPLSHISILSQNRKTPLIALKGAADATSILSLVNKNVKFEVSQDSFQLIPDSPGNSCIPEKQHKLVTLSIDTLTASIVPLKMLRMKHKGTYGVKAVNLAQLQRVRYKGKPILTPEGAFAIPIYYYWQHLKTYGTDSLISQLLNNYKILTKIDIQIQLEHIRKSINNAAIDHFLISKVEEMITASGTSKRYRFRSSSNAEDLEGFNGAGLYTSETGSKPRSIEKAIKEVWASLWNERAFEERCLAGINQKTIGMAILAHRSFPHEYANGVAITRNLYRDFDFGFVVNVQAGDNSLVKPSEKQTCDQFISYFNTEDPFFNEKDAVEYLSFSSLNNNQPLLTKEEIFDLTRQLDEIKKRFYRKLKAWKQKQYKDFAMDVEFKAEIVNNKKVFYFKQARPFD